MKQEFKIVGMDCAEEVDALKSELRPLIMDEGLLSFDILRGRMSVAIGPETLSPEKIKEVVARTGMTAEIWSDNASRSDDGGSRQRRLRMLLTVTSGTFVVIGFLAHVVAAGSVRGAFGSEGMGLAHGVPLLARLFYGVAILSGAWFVLPKAWFSLRRVRPDMNLLMTLAVVGAVAIGEWFEAATVAFLFAVSLTLESWSVGRARRAVESLLAIAPSTVRIVTAEGEREVPADSVPAGTSFFVRPGARIALDGEVVKGTSEVNQAPITGESVPVTKEPGASVFAGTINGNGALEVRSTKASADTTLAHIIRMVGAAQAQKAPSEQWVEGFARFYTPLVFASAILVFLLPPLVFGAAWEDWAYRALVLLVIGCPCALVISTPVSIVAALAASARNGVLVKGGVYVEAPAHVKAIAMDKTGTLTEGRPSVAEVVPEPGMTETELLEIAATMESQSDHPLAVAISEYCKGKGITPRQVEGLTAIQGKGATGTIGGRNYWIGSHRYLEERNQETRELHERLERLASSGKSVVVIGNERVVGMITLADAVREESVRSIAALRRAGVKHVVMLTGDNRPTAEVIARKTGVNELYAELLPEDKVTFVENLVAKYGSVAMVGDGVNDAPAMARATLGIAMGAVGSDAAIEASDIALMSDDLSKLPWLVRHSRRALGIIRQNITLSLAVKAVFVVLTFAGHASLWAAIAADMGVSLLVIFNALRLLQSPSTNEV